jgi:hypothetical protein
MASLVPFSVGPFRSGGFDGVEGRANVMLTPPQAAGSIWQQTGGVFHNPELRPRRNQVLRGAAGR